MEFVDKLDPEQRDNALIVAKQAKQLGINPRLAVSLAYQESGLRTPEKPGAAGEIGIMQIKPATAEMIGFSREDIDNPNQNIKAGLTYLKMGLDKFGDPVLAVAGYNAGHDHPYFTNPEKGLPESTKNYLKSIKGLGGFTLVSEEGDAAEDAGAEAGPVEVSEEDLTKQKTRIMTDVLGAGAGAVAAKGLQVGSDVMETAKAIGANARAQAAAAQAGMAPGAAGAPGARPGGLPAPQGPLQGPPAGGKMTQNWIGAQDTTGAYRDVGMKARSMGEAHQMKEAAIQAENKIRQIAPEMRQVPERAGLFLPEQTGSGPRGARTVPIGPPPQPPGPGALQKVTEAAKTGAGAVARSPVTMGALGGLGAAESGQEFYSRYKQGDIPGMVLSGLGTVGGLASAVPHPIVRGIGVGVSTVSPLALYLLDKMRGKVPPEALMQPQ